MKQSERLIKQYGYNGAIVFIHKNFNCKEEAKHRTEDHKEQYNNAKKEWFEILDEIVYNRMKESIKN